jgi:hypothetical protein
MDGIYEVVGNAKRLVRCSVPTEAGFYWATSIRRNKSKRLSGGGQIGGLRWIVRVIDHGDELPMKVQVFGDGSDLLDLCDYTDWEGPLGKPHMVDVRKSEAVVGDNGKWQGSKRNTSREAKGCQAECQATSAPQ